MPRIDKINEELKHALSSLIPTLKDPRVTGLISVTRVDATPDLKTAEVFISVLPEDAEPGVVTGLRSASGFLRRELGRRVELRAIPELRFEADSSIRHGAHIAELLGSIESGAEEADED